MFHSDLTSMTPIELYTCIAQSLVASPELLDINPAMKNGRLVPTEITVTTSIESDYGRLIGGQGRTYRACLDLLQACSMKVNGPKINLAILKTQSKASFLSRFVNKENWGHSDDKRLMAFSEKILDSVLPFPYLISISSIHAAAGSLPHDASSITVKAHGEVHECISGAMKIILHAIGRVRGRIVFVEFK